MVYSLYIYLYKRSFCGKPKKIHYNVNIHNQIMKKEKNKSFFIFTRSYEQKHNTPHIVICDLGTVLDLHPLHSFTYLENKWYCRLVYLYTWACV